MLVGRRRPEPVRASSANFAPPSPWAFDVPWTSAMPLPMMVWAMMSCGFPLLAFFARLKALKKPAMSWPSIVCTSHSIALKRCAVFSLCVLSAMASSVT